MLNVQNFSSTGGTFHSQKGAKELKRMKRGGPKCIIFASLIFKLQNVEYLLECVAIKRTFLEIMYLSGKFGKAI